MAAGMSSLLLAAGKKGKRTALPHSKALLLQPNQGVVRGQASDIQIAAQQLLETKERMLDEYEELTGQPREKVRRDFDRAMFLTAQESIDYGIVDKIAEPRQRRVEDEEWEKLVGPPPIQKVGPLG
jgi:ATP-dependent Clp protease protease subunit